MDGEKRTKPWRSRLTTDGLDRTPHRAFLRATGLDDAAIARPMIGVVTTHAFQPDLAGAVPWPDDPGQVR